MKTTSKEKNRGKDRWRNRRDSTERSQRLLWKSERKKKTGRAGGQKNEGRKERLKAFIDEKETKRRRKPALKMDYERSVDKSYAKKRQWGSLNS
jgi:hypothetical protein